MAALELTAEEADILREVLAGYVSDLRMEITDTEDKEFREELKRHEEVIGSILGRLGASVI